MDTLLGTTLANYIIAFFRDQLAKGENSVRVDLSTIVWGSRKDKAPDKRGIEDNS